MLLLNKKYLLCCIHVHVCVYVVLVLSWIMVTVSQLLCWFYCTPANKQSCLFARLVWTDGAAYPAGLCCPSSASLNTHLLFLPLSCIPCVFLTPAYFMKLSFVYPRNITNITETANSAVLKTSLYIYTLVASNTPPPPKQPHTHTGNQTTNSLLYTGSQDTNINKCFQEPQNIIALDMKEWNCSVTLFRIQFPQHLLFLNLFLIKIVIYKPSSPRIHCDL